MQTNEKLVKDFYNSFKIKDRDYSLFCQDNIEWITMEGMPAGGRYVGIDSVFEEYFPKMLSNFEEFHADPTEFLCIDDKVIVFGRYHGQTKIGKKFIVPFCHLYTIKDYKIFRFNQYTDTLIINDAITD
jgi:ketosteroid isomerase-like protein